MPNNSDFDNFFDDLMDSISKANAMNKKKLNITTEDEAIRDLAKTSKKIYDAHIKEGFTPSQATQILVALIRIINL